MRKREIEGEDYSSSGDDSATTCAPSSSSDEEDEVPDLVSTDDEKPERVVRSLKVEPLSDDE